jgi:hypothetical protein
MVEQLLVAAQATLNGIIATFFTLGVIAIGEGSVTNDHGIDCPDDCTEDYEEGTETGVRAFPAEGWEFDGWSGDCTITGDDVHGPFCAITMDGDKDVTATFTEIDVEPVTHTLEVSTEGGDGSGIVTSNPEGIDCGEDCSEEFEEKNTHGFDNTGQGASHVRGLYRWIDKVYSAQVASYGLRSILEFVVPEPAALYRFAQSNLPRTGLTLGRPDPPGYCVGASRTFLPLSPGDLSESNYLFWVGKYGVSGVIPPPPRYRTIGIAVNQAWQDVPP